MLKRHAWWIPAVWLLLVASAQAQVSAAEKAAAEALFDRGLQLLREGKLEEACAQLEQSNSIERGIGTMLYLADCYEKSGRTASAWALFREAASEAQAAGQGERANAGRQRAARLEPNLSRLTIDVPEAQRVPGLEIRRNDVIVPRGAWSVPLPVDPGPQHIEARAPSYQPFEQTLTVERGPGAWRIELPALTPAPVAEAPAVPSPAEAVASTPPVSAPEPSVPAATQSAARPTRDGSTARLVGVVLGSAGVAMIAVGGGFGIRAIRKKKDADELCPSKGDCASAAGVKASDDADKAATLSTVGWSVGGALLAGGLLTYLLAPKRETQVALSVDSRGAVLGVGGVF